MPLSKYGNGRMTEALTLLSTIVTKPRFIPLCLAIGSFDLDHSPNSAFLAAGGTRNDISIYSLRDLFSDPKAELAASPKGHDGWIRSLALCVHTVTVIKYWRLRALTSMYDYGSSPEVESGPSKFQQIQQLRPCPRKLSTRKCRRYLHQAQSIALPLRLFC